MGEWGQVTFFRQLADGRWANVSLALIEGVEVPSTSVLSFVRPALDKRP